MKNCIAMPSLLPYLDARGNKFGLRLSLIPESVSAQEKSLFPFTVISDNGSLTRLIEGHILTDAGSDVKRVFFLVQKDEYHFEPDELWPLGNRDIERCWQRAFALYSGKILEGSPLIFSDQIGEDGGVRPFRPLFYCAPRKTFFHPPCPRCGHYLEQCDDDELLKSLGLQIYSTSLRRYLFCPDCLDSKGQSDFYTYALQASDPPMLKDRWALIREFGQLKEAKAWPPPLPCTDCGDDRECLDAVDLAAAGIVPFAFYPFFGLVFEAPSVSALDFLSMISGAPFSDLKSQLREKGELGRIHAITALEQNGSARPMLFFEKNEKAFLEILYLKLSFLGELAQKIFSGLNTFRYPDLGLSMAGIWVKFADQGGLLPYFWNFQLKFLDIGWHGAETKYLPKLPPSYGLYFLGDVWFHVMLVNRAQPGADVRQALGQIMEASLTTANDPFEDFLRAGSSQVFAPANVFWDPGKNTVGKKAARLWEDSLRLGWFVLRADSRRDSGWSKDEFWQAFERLRGEIKERLFYPEAPAEIPKSAPKDQPIHDILVKIMEKWRGGVAAEPQAEAETGAPPVTERKHAGPPPMVFREEKPSEETAILAPAEPGEETMVTEQVEEALEETVVLHPAESEGVGKARRSPGEEAEMRESAILAPEELAEKAPPPDESREEIELPPTVIISPEKESEAPPKPSPQRPPEEAGLEKRTAAPGRDLGQTSEETLELEKSDEDAEEEDFLAETVILRPAKDRDKE